MKAWSAIFNIFASLILVMLSLAYFNVDKVITRDFDQARMNQAVEYATEAMFISTLEVEDIGIDYTDLDVVSINPGDSLDVFTEMLCFSYGISVSEENRRLIEDSIGAIVLSGNDGFYITQLVEDDTTPGNGIAGGEFVLKWSTKIPYFLNTGGKTYALNIGKEKWASITSGLTINVPTDVGYPPGITAGKALDVANSQITNTIYNEIMRRNLGRKSFEYKFFLPAETTKAGVNPIQGPGILTLLQGAPFASSEKISAVSVAGYKTTKRVSVVAFTEMVGGTPRKYYCYVGQMDPDDIRNDMLGTGKYRVENFYKTTRAAAGAGYSPHYGLIAKKVTGK